MKALAINFFSTAENSPTKAKRSKSAKPVKVELTGYISSTGKLTLPAKTVANLGINLDDTLFKVGMDQGKRKTKSLYLVPASGSEETFSLEKAAKSYTLSLPVILTKSGVNYAQTKYAFTIHLFDYNGSTAFELKLAPEAGQAKVPYTGKPRGRKPKSAQAVE